VLLEPREHDANFFSVNPIAFWRRAEALQHGFESVRHTVDQNFDQLKDVFGLYGIELSRAAARRKAEQAEADRGWGASPDAPALRLVS
jgi:hypothetical protein